MGDVLARVARGHRGLMAGKPFLWKIARDIDEHGGEPWFFGRIADGDKLKAIALDLGCSRSLLYEWIALEPERAVALRAARRLAAHSIVEDTDDELKTAFPLTPMDAQVLNTRVRFRQWLASRYNREDLGEERGAQVVVNVGSLHADALRARVNPPALPVPVVDAEVVVEE